MIAFFPAVVNHFLQPRKETAGVRLLCRNTRYVLALRKG